MRQLFKTLWAIIAIICSLAVTGCGSSAKMTAKVDHYNRDASIEKAKIDMQIDPTLPSLTQRLLAEARTWIGVPYMYGGNDRNGVDCSGLVTQIFLNALKIKLPRTSQSQSEWCRTIDREALRPGDLVFFDTTGSREGRVSHVGLYIGEGNMIHASSSKGVVMVSPIGGIYFGERHLKSGRVDELEQ